MKTINLTGDALDWAVDKSLNLNTPYNSWGQTGKVPLYSTDWSQGGPIIEREGIAIMHIADRQPSQKWEAGEEGETAQEFWGLVCGPTPLIAAMRCYVASKLGDDVEIPEALCNQ